MKPRHHIAAHSRRSALVAFVALLLLVGAFIDAAAQSTASTPLVWGSNSAGQLGYPNPESDLSPDFVVGLGPGSGVTAISAGGAHSLALKSDGTVLAWGSNGNGQLGDGTTTPRTTPVAVSGLGPGSGVVAIATGGAHSLALKSDGTVLAWGGNGNGQLGDGTTTQRTTPVAVSAPGGLGALNVVIAVAAGGGHSLALRSDSTVLAWGSNANGQLGDGTITQRTTPVAVRAIGGVGTLSGVTMIAAGGAYSLALSSDGTVAAWGFNPFGQLGDGTTTQRTTAVAVSDVGGVGALNGVMAVAAGGGHSLALRSDSAVLAWGANGPGQLGDGTTTNRLSPVLVNTLGAGSGVVAITTGNGHSLALESDGTVLAWGSNPSGPLGDSTTTNRLTPVSVSGLGPGSAVVALAADANGFHSLALTSDGTVLAWGSNANGQLGDGSIHAKLEPYPLPGVGGTVAAVGAFQYSLALSVDATVMAWGANNNGQLGDGTTTTRATPLPVTDPSWPTGLLTGVIAIAGVNAHSLALKSDGTVMAWGFNGTGQLGDGTTTNRLTAVPVSGLGAGSDVVAIAAGGFHSLALKADGTVLAWGNNGTGQLGDGTTTGSTTPVAVSGLGPGSGVVAVHANGSHSLALKSDGTILAWGSNGTGQLGVGDTVRRLSPTPVSSLGSGSGVLAIAAGGSHSLALKSDGTVLAWGGNGSGQLGDGTITQRTTPVQVSGLGVGSGVVAIDAGAGHSLALHFNGTVQAWGSNASGQLGDGTLENRLTAVQVSGLGFGSGVTVIATGGNHSFALPPLSIGGLVETLRSLSTPQPGWKSVLLAISMTAQKALDRGNTRVAENLLKIFIKLVEALQGRVLTDSQANLLVAYANKLILLI